MIKAQAMHQFIHDCNIASVVSIGLHNALFTHQNRYPLLLLQLQTELLPPTSAQRKLGPQHVAQTPQQI
jgi:hypothetical protein